MKNYLDLLKVLPKSNCKSCGLESCLLFALKVFSREISPEKCPYLDLKLLPPELSSSTLSFNQLLENLKFLKRRFRDLNLLEIAPSLEAGIDPDKRVVFLSYMDKTIQIPLTEEGHPTEFKTEEQALDPRDEILLCNYFIFNGKTPLADEFVGLESFPHSLSKVKTLKHYAEDPLAELIDLHKERLLSHLRKFRVENLERTSSGLSFLVWVLPKVPLRIVFWEGEEEEGLLPSCKVLYNAQALSYLDLECLVFCAERFYELLRDRLERQ